MQQQQEQKEQLGFCARQRCSHLVIPLLLSDFVEEHSRSPSHAAPRLCTYGDQIHNGAVIFLYFFVKYCWINMLLLLNVNHLQWGENCR